MFMLPKMLEVITEKKIVKYLKEKHNIDCDKFEIKKSYPDRICLGEKGIIFFIEFKRKGEKPTALQKHTKEYLKEKGFETLIIDDYQTGIKQINQLIERMK